MSIYLSAIAWVLNWHCDTSDACLIRGTRLAIESDVLNTEKRISMRTRLDVIELSPVPLTLFLSYHPALSVQPEVTQQSHQQRVQLATQRCRFNRVNELKRVFPLTLIFPRSFVPSSNNFYESSLHVTNVLTILLTKYDIQVLNSNFVAFKSDERFFCSLRKDGYNYS